MNKDIGQVEHKLGVNDRPTSSRPPTRSRTSRGGRRGKKAAAEEPLPEKPGTKGGNRNNKSRVVSEVNWFGWFISQALDYNIL